MARSPHAASPKHQPETRSLRNHEPTRSILHLPLEIQCEIFTHAHYDDSNNEASCLPVEVVLSHVCSKWRNIAINLPTLWTAFKFDTHFRVSDPVRKLEAYISRSGTQLLELYFSFSGSDYNHAADLHTPYELFASDFALVELPLPTPTVGIDSPSSLMTQPRHSISLTVFTNANHGNINPLILTRGGAPRLRTVRIDTTTPFHSLPPLSNITTLAIQGREGGYFCFEFHTLRSILTIPTLTNLSIETWRCFYRDWANNPLRIKMPSLKTLRISQDSTTLRMLSFIDAPSLETLVLHAVDLRLVNTGQDIHKITTFIRLDTIAFLDCQYRFSNLYQELVNRIDMILHTLSCHATHIIISNHGGPSFIERDSNLLDFHRYMWPSLERITLDLSTFSDRMSYVRILEGSPQSITVRVVEPVFDQWARRPGGLTTLEKVCRLETMKVGDAMMDDPWPASGGLFREDGNLKNRFIWGETFRAKGPDQFLDD